MNANSISAITLILLGSFCVGALAHDELTQERIADYTNDGTLQERKSRIATLKPFHMGEGTQQRAVYKMRRAALEASGVSAAEAARSLTSGRMMAFPFTVQPELMSTGTVRTLTILIDFKDHRAINDLPGMTTQSFIDNIYGTGTPAAQAFKPYESLHEYYRRASQDQVDVQGNVLEWYHFPNNRKDYEPQTAPATLPPKQAENDNKAIFKMLSEAMDAVDARHDFAQYDNDNDGDIDLVTIVYAGPDNGWGGFWWAYRWQFYVPEAQSRTFDGKRAKQFVFQFASKRGDGTDFDPRTLMHEMGHAFGLADYYDYDDTIGPPGGVGGLDMMDANTGNQNAFSRWLLDWIKPSVIGSGPPKVKPLNASASVSKTDKAIAVFPGLADLNAPSQEMFLLENRFPAGNDTSIPGVGVLIWHVTATVNAAVDDFAFDNSFTDFKLIRLMRADNAADFSIGEHAGVGTFFTKGKVFSPNSTPNSSDNAGNATHVVVDEISDARESMTVRVGFDSVAPVPAPPPIAAAAAPASQPNDTVTVESVLARQTPIDLDTLEALDRQFSTATTAALAQECKAIGNQDPTKTNPETKLAVVKLLMSRMAAKNGALSAEGLFEWFHDDQIQNETLPLILSSWVHNAPADAARWYLDDKQVAVRKRPAFQSPRFARDAFAGLYAVAPDEATTEKITKLASSAEILGAVDGILNAGAGRGDSMQLVTEKLLQSKSELVRARLDVLKAIKDAEDKITDPKVKRDFQKLNARDHE